MGDHIWMAQKLGLLKNQSKGQSKGWDKDKGKGKGKKWSTARCYAEKKVWIGGLPKNKTSRDLNKALKDLMGATFAEIGKSGTGTATFRTEDEAANAQASFNGVRFQGSVLKVDLWSKK